MPYGYVSMLLLDEGSEATEPYNKYDKIRPHSIRSLQFDQKVRPLSFRPEKFDLFTATQRASPMCSCGLSQENAYHFFFSSTLHDKFRPHSLQTLNLMRTEDCTSFKTFLLKTKKLQRITRLLAAEL